MTALAKVTTDPQGLTEVMKLSEMLARAGGGFIPTHLKNPGQVAAVVLAGQELGIGPMAAMRGLFLIEGKVGLDASLIGALMRKAGVRMTWAKSDDTEAVLHCERDGLTHDETFTIEDAKRAGLAGKDVWKKYPKSMLRARATSGAARAFCADVFYGAVYTPDEVQDARQTPESKPTLASITAKHVTVEATASEIATGDATQPTPEDLAHATALERLGELDALTDGESFEAWCRMHGGWFLGLSKDSDERKAVYAGIMTASKRLAADKDDVRQWLTEAEVVNG